MNEESFSKPTRWCIRNIRKRIERKNGQFLIRNSALYNYDLPFTKWIHEKGRIMMGKKDLTKEIAEELDVLDNMLNALVELLEEKGIITQEEWGKKIKAKTTRAGGLLGYRDIQFSEKRE